MLQSPKEDDDAGSSNLDATAVLLRIGTLVDARSDRALAGRIGVPTSTIASWKSRNSIPLSYLIELSKRHEVSLDWLVFGGDFAPRRVLAFSDAELRTATFKMMENTIDRTLQTMDRSVNGYLRLTEKIDRLIASLEERAA